MTVVVPEAQHQLDGAIGLAGALVRAVSTAVRGKDAEVRLAPGAASTYFGATGR